MSHNSINRDDIISKLSQFTSIYRAYLLVKFHDDWRSRTCWTKSYFKQAWHWKWHFFDACGVIYQQHKVGYTLILSKHIFYGKSRVLITLAKNLFSILKKEVRNKNSSWQRTYKVYFCDFYYLRKLLQLLFLHSFTLSLKGGWIFLKIKEIQ